MFGKPLKIRLLSFEHAATLFLFLVLLGIRFQFLPRLNLAEGQKVKLTGTLNEEPQIAGSRQSFRLGQFMLWLEKYPEYHYGNQLEIVGQVKIQPSKFSFLPKTFFLENPKIKILGQKGIFFKILAINWARKIREVYLKTFPKPLDGFISGIVLGDKSLLDKEISLKLQKTGTIHIMVASGMNVALLAGSILPIFAILFKRKIAIVFLYILILLYSIMTGLQAPIIRAAIMIGLFYLGQLLGRQTNGSRLLWLAGGTMLLINPLWLFEVGFQLSFLATAGLVYLAPWFQKKHWPESFSSSLAAQIMTLPVLLVSFGQVNLLSPIINLLLLWSIPYLLSGGILLGIAGVVWIKLAEMASYLVYPLLFYLEQIINLFAKITLFQVQLPNIGIIIAIVYYSFIVLILTDSERIDTDLRKSAKNLRKSQ